MQHIFFPGLHAETYNRDYKLSSMKHKDNRFRNRVMLVFLFREAITTSWKEVYFLCLTYLIHQFLERTQQVLLSFYVRQHSSVP